jgi:hypothetical protein
MVAPPWTAHSSAILVPPTREIIGWMGGRGQSSHRRAHGMERIEAWFGDRPWNLSASVQKTSPSALASQFCNCLWLVCPLWDRVTARAENGSPHALAEALRDRLYDRIYLPAGLDPVCGSD